MARRNDAMPRPEGLAELHRRLKVLPGGGSAIRLDGDRLSTAVRTFAHPRSARFVTLVGTMHIGESDYFGQLSDIVEGLAARGAAVHVEGIGDHDGESHKGSETYLLAASYSWAHPETGAAAFLDVESQGARLRLPKGVCNFDLSHVELLRRVGWRNYRRLFAPQLAAPASRRAGRFVRAAMAFELRHRAGLEWLRSMRGRNRLVNRVVIHERNLIAFKPAVEALVSSDVVLVWGADHLPGLARMFAIQGYHLRREEWYEACRI